jgi:hypothetical protein
MRFFDRLEIGLGMARSIGVARGDAFERLCPQRSHFAVDPQDCGGSLADGVCLLCGCKGALVN